MITSIPAFGLGTWGQRSDATELVAAAVGMGYRMIDTASGYVNEREVGEGLRQCEVDRETLTISTKFPTELAGQEEEVLQFSLNALQLSYVDIWLLHGELPPDQLLTTWSHFESAKDRGLARAIGVSNCTLGGLDCFRDATGVYPDVNQTFAAVDADLEFVLAEHRRRGVSLVAHSPFRYPQLQTLVPAGPDWHERVLQAYTRHGAPVLAGSRSTEHLRSNLAATRHAPN